MPKGFLYAEFEVQDATEFEKYREKVAAVSASFGGRYVVRRSEPAGWGMVAEAAGDHRVRKSGAGSGVLRLTRVSGDPATPVALDDWARAVADRR